MYEKAITLASKFPNTYVFGGYVRDVIIGGKDEKYIKDLDLFFQKETDVDDFIMTLSIFFKLKDEIALRGECYTAYLDNENDVRTCTFVDDKKQSFNIDCVFPNHTNDPRLVKEPISLEHIDMDVNMFYLKLQDSCGIQMCRGPHHKIFKQKSICLALNTPVFWTKTIRGIYDNQFTVLNTPRQLAEAHRKALIYASIYKNYVSNTRDFNNERKKACKLILRAEKMVSRGWTQTTLEDDKTEWLVVKFNKIQELFDKKHWESLKEIIQSETKCSICHSDYKPEDSVFLSPCGHTFHVCCEKSNTITGLIGWINQMVRNSVELRKKNLPDQGKEMCCMICSKPFF